MTTSVNEEHEIGEYGKELWAYLTGQDATISYKFDNMEVQVPRTTGLNSPRAMWQLNGTVQIAASDRDARS